MADVKYLANRLKYHAASRVATQTGEALVQALNVDGHTVTTNKIWTAPMSAFVNNSDKTVTESIAATTELATIFKTTGTPVSSTFNGGTVWTNSAYPAVKLYEGVQMTKVVGSDGGGKFQSFEILEAVYSLTKDSEFLEDKTYYTVANNEYSTATVTVGDSVPANTYYEREMVRVTDWISPTAVADQTNGKPVAGYSGIPMFNGIPLKQHSMNWAEGDGRYEFIYMAGLLTFEPGFTPQEMGSNGENLVSITAFKYIGEYADQAEATQNTRLATIEAQLGMGGGGEQEGPVTEQLLEVEKTISGYTSTSTISSAISTEANARTTADNFLSGVLSGYETVGAVSAAIKNLTDTAATYQLSAISTTEGYAFSYQLMKTANGVTTAVENSIINIPKDQFLSAAVYDSETENLNLTFATKTKDASGAETETANTVSIPMSSMVHEYEGGNGITVTDVTNGASQITVKLDTTTEGRDAFLTVGADGLLLSGVQDAIDAASNDATTGLEALSSALTDFTGENAVSAKFTEVDERLDADETNISTLSAALSGYLGEGAVSSAIKGLSDAIDGIRTDTNVVSAFQNSSSVSGTIGNHTLSVDVKRSANAGNAITIESDGLFAQAYKAGTNISFGAAEDGIIPINADYTYTLSAATASELGGILSGAYIAVDASGNAVVKKVENSLTIFGQAYDGSAAITLTENSDYLSSAISNGTITLDVVANGEIAENNTGLIKGGQVYTVVESLSNAIDDAKDALSSQVSAAFEQDEVVIGTNGGITASGYKIGADDSEAAFGAASTVASEARVEEYVNDGLETLFNAVSGFNAELE